VALSIGVSVLYVLFVHTRREKREDYATATTHGVNAREVVTFNPFAKMRGGSGYEPSAVQN